MGDRAGGGGGGGGFSPSNGLGGRKGTRDDSAEILSQSSLQKKLGHREQFRHGQGRPLFDVMHPVFPLPTLLYTRVKKKKKKGPA